MVRARQARRPLYRRLSPRPAERLRRPHLRQWQDGARRVGERHADPAPRHRDRFRAAFLILAAAARARRINPSEVEGRTALMQRRTQGSPARRTPAMLTLRRSVCAGAGEDKTAWARIVSPLSAT